MSEAVTDIIVSRSRAQESLTKMVVWSVGLHAAVITGVFVLPQPKAASSPVVMTISLSGSEGPKVEGMTEAASSAVQAVKPPEAAKPVTAAPAPVRPEMTLPDPKAKTRPTVKPREAPPDASSRALNTGAEVKPGTAPAAPPQVRGQGFGVASPGGSDGMTLEGVKDFCCPEYLVQLREAIKAKWAQHQTLAGSNVVKFTILRDGTIQGVQLERATGLNVLDNESVHALEATAKVGRLPQAYPNSTLTIHLTFEYQK